MKKVAIIALFIIVSVFVSAESWNIDVKNLTTKIEKILKTLPQNKLQSLSTKIIILMNTTKLVTDGILKTIITNIRILFLHI